MPRKSLYNADSMESAIFDVKNNIASLRGAAKKYGVPKSTLEFKLKNPGHKDSCGPSPILTLKEELNLVKWIEELASRGFPRKKDDILNSVQHFLMENPRPNPFKNHRPGDCWLKAFLRRHPTIVQRTSEAVSSASACVSEADIRKWFTEIKGYLDSKNIDLHDPSRIFNGDETGFKICPSTGKVFAGKGVKNVYAVEKGSPKENITVMFCFSAIGMTCPPMIIYPYKRIPEKIASTVNPTWGIGRSDNGWMTSETFYEYIKNIFHPHLIENNVKFPVILFPDGYRSHLTHELSLLCNELNIEVIALYPNATRIIQPCDVAVFRPIKMGWKRTVREFYEKNPGQVLNKTTFAPLLEKVVADVVNQKTLENGFKACGLFPFNPNGIDFTKCLGKQKELSKVRQAYPLMDKRTFIGFIGEETLAKFKTFDANVIKEGSNEEFLTLHEMWKYFGKPDIENKIENDEGEFGIEMENKFELKAIDIISKEPNNELEASSSSEIKYESIELVKPKVLTYGTNQAECYKAHENKIHSEVELDLVAETTNLNKINIIENILIKEKDTGSVYEISNDSPRSPFTCLDNICPNLSETACPSTSNIFADTSKTCISAYLKIPEKLQRKNKRNMERVSYAITSKAYQECFEAKRNLKLEEEKKKLERKRLREERAAKKANMQNKRVRMSKDAINKRSKNNNCFMCRRNIESCRYFKCNICKNFLHNLCVPTTHKNHIPDLEDNDLFVCFREDSDEEADSKGDIDKPKLDEELHTEENENDDIEELFEMYKNEYAKYK